MNVFDLTGTLEPAWRADRACTDADPDIFFPEKGRSLEPALAYCHRCPVSDECLAWALEHHEMGVWGGTSGRERRRMARRVA